MACHLDLRRCRFEFLKARSRVHCCLFLLYAVDLEDIANDHGLMSHFYADDLQLFLFRRLDEIQRL